jgi:energy-coupling factor transport system permease protein
MIGFRPGHSLLHKAHPYTPLAVAGALLCLVFAARAPGEVFMLTGVAIMLTLAGGSLRYVARPALMLALPTWVLLLVLHGLLGPEPHHMVGLVSVSTPGLTRALVFGGRIIAILFAFLSVLATVSPARLVEAMTERGVSFGAMYLLVSTLTLVPRLRARAAQILEAQQCRGLRLGGSPVARVRALGPLVLPLVLGALMEVDEQVLALDTRGASMGATRTALDPPNDTTAEWVLRLVCVILVLAAWSGRLLEVLEPLQARLVSLL